MSKLDITGIGRAFTDVIARVDHKFLATAGLKCGIGTELSGEKLIEIHNSLESFTLIPGGSPSNTVAGIAALGGRTAFLGKVCNDFGGRAFRNAFNTSKVLFPNTYHPDEQGALSPTCLILSTPDDIVTMAYSRGVGDRLNSEDMHPQIITKSKIVLFQAHLFLSDESCDSVSYAMRTARTAGTKIAITLNDLYAPTDSLGFLAEADFIIGNLQEFEVAFPGRKLDDFQSGNRLFVITDGENGATISGMGSLFSVSPSEFVTPETLSPRTFVGAGDQFAGGFLLGYASGLPLEACGRLATECAIAIIRTVGARPVESWKHIATKYLGGKADLRRAASSRGIENYDR